MGYKKESQGIRGSPCVVEFRLFSHCCYKDNYVKSEHDVK